MVEPLQFLIVEDSISDVRLLVHELKKSGISAEILRAETEEEYLVHLNSLPDIIFCDYNLPQFDALRALELLREKSSDIPFIVVSGSIGEETAVQAIKQGATDYLLKDRLGRLGTAVHHALDERRFRAAERQVREELARDALILAHVQDSVIMTDLDGIVTYWNAGATRLFGWTAEEMLGKPYTERFAESVRPLIAEGIKERLAGLEWNAEFEDYRKDGSRVWVHARVFDIADQWGKQIGILGISYDITERKNAEVERINAQILREQELRERETILLENARLLRAATETAVQQRQFLKDVLSSVTEGRLTLCDSESELPAPLAHSRSPIPAPQEKLSPPPVPLTTESLRQLRRQVEEATTACALPAERQYDFLMAVGEAAMNAVVHAGGGMAQVFGDAAAGKVQVWIADKGTGIELARLPRATLERGFSTVGTLGHGFWMILQTCDRVHLLTGPLGTTVVLEQGITPPEPSWLAEI